MSSNNAKSGRANEKTILNLWFNKNAHWFFNRPLSL